MGGREGGGVVGGGGIRVFEECGKRVGVEWEWGWELGWSKLRERGGE